MKCYDTNCTNEVEEEFSYCPSCKQRNYPNHKQTLMEKPREFKFKALSTPVVKTEKTETSLFDLNFDQLKTLEKKASDWLSENKHLEKSEPERWAKAMSKYRRIVKFLNLKTL